MTRDETLKPRKGSKNRARRPKRTKADRGEPSMTRDETLKPRKGSKEQPRFWLYHPPFREGRGGSLFNHKITCDDSLVETEISGNERTWPHLFIMSEPFEYVLK